MHSFKSRKYILNFRFEKWKININFDSILKINIESNIHSNTSNEIDFKIRGKN